MPSLGVSLKKSLGRLAGAALATAVITLVAAPAAMAQDDPATSTTPTDPSTTTTTSTPTTSETSPSSTVPTSATSSADTTTSEPGTTRDPAAKAAPRTTDSAPTTTATAPPEKPFHDNVGHGYIGLTGEGVLVIACAEGAPGNVATANLTVTAGPDQDEADGRYWNYDVRIVSEANGKTSFSWTCDGKPGQGDVDFQQAPPTGDPSTTPSTTPSAPSATTGAPATTTTAPAGTRPQAQVRYAPKYGVETGFGGMAPA